MTTTLTKRKPILEIKGLKQYFPVKRESLFQPRQEVKAVDDISFTLFEGETLSIVGESGCGKSTTGRAILQLDKPTEGTIKYNGVDLNSLSKKEMRKMRGDIQVIFQDPFASLNPRQTVRKILKEAMTIQKVVPPSQQEKRMRELLDYVGLPIISLDRLPHEFSGGQRQRIGIARALAVNPKIIICDEAVSALDVSIQAQILNLLKRLQKEFHLTYLFISHDLSVVRHISDRVMVMYLGKLVEVGSKHQLFQQPAHPYTKALLSAIPVADITTKSRERIILKGDVPSPLNPPSGCKFHTRCPLATELCKAELPPMIGNEGHFARCHYLQ
ncbi:peptide/nickel transport system ATP-binding protein/oligopeptide transport system ATP-binding protein [Bacillus pakistanensis]|uniref:Peptide/nickel transport system ATP-binding protein/oligopeptide transport system ATP-binding protein n=1 Tax=Rossellomorea pakistanensis TaxID=992288 RepID=A0ABS2NCW9_9BACI|nr:dipeptide ABC transporter ATP-binding protein [Bacillus pakistanensis]MBM7585707.1 peptide/nickel transport system ATP-binding protein/oligopeptide transport system ATP-binding protein [Bacillus pakistanensis]